MCIFLIRNDICYNQEIRNITMCPSCSYDQCKSYKLGENCQYSKVY